MQTAYSPEFFQKQVAGSHESAKQIVPLLMGLVRPQSVVDVGCGTGTWLSVFRNAGVQDFLGIDGDYVSRDALRIPADRFRAADLTRPLKLDRRFDLAISLEVGEHLPPESAGDFVESLTSLAPVVAFSAAIPYQGGTDHRNEQWPEYWAKKFQDRGYVAVDCVRRKVWWNPSVEFWYSQNLIVYVDRQTASGLPDDSPLKRLVSGDANEPLAFVHPFRWMRFVEQSRDSGSEFVNPSRVDLQRIGLKRVLLGLPSLMVNSIVGRVRRRR